MTLPDYATFRRSFLDCLADHSEKTMDEIGAELVSKLDLTVEDLEESTRGGSTTGFLSRLGWSRQYLRRAGAVEYSRPGYLRITPRGAEILREHSHRITRTDLQAYPEFASWKRRKASPTKPQVESGAEPTPIESIMQALDQIEADVQEQLLDLVRHMDPTTFEHLVLQLMKSLGYGRATGAGEHLGRSGDGGLDGVIHEDKLGLERIYLQAKRWEQVIGSPRVREFAGSLDGMQARKGVMITTSSYSRDATEYVERIEKRIVLLDGNTLARLMYDAGIGVTTEETVVIKRVDSDYFQPDA